MGALTWNGGTGDWYDPSRWTDASTGTAGAPEPGDEVTIASGDSRLVGSDAEEAGSFDDQSVLLGSPDRRARPRITTTNAVFGIYFDVAVPAGDSAGIVDRGTSGFDGSLDVTGTLDIDATHGAGGSPSDFVFTSDALLTVHRSGRLDLDGDVKLETGPGQSVVDGGGTLSVDGTLTMLGATLRVEKNATLSGTGAIDIGLASTLDVGGRSASSLSIAFDGPGGVLKIGAAADFASRIDGFSTGDTIDLGGVSADDAAFDPATDSIDVRQGGATGTLVAELAVSSVGPGQLQAVSDGKGGTLIGYAGSKPALGYAIDTTDQALGADIVRATMSTRDGAPIDGSGVTIGIVSDSFDATGTADAAAAAGYLPSDPSDGTAAVDVLDDDPSGSDEGQAMAELIHQIAPGAQIDFASGGDSVGATARAVTALQQAGCQIITDDLGYPQEPAFQVTDKLDRSIETAIDDGVSYFTAASNEGEAFFQSAFTPAPTVLAGQSGPAVSAEQFGDGTAYQTITATGGERLAIDLQWDAAYPRHGQGVPDALVADLYDMQGNLVATSHQLELGGAAIPEVEIDLRTPSAEFTDYRLAIYQPDGTPAVGQFIYTLDGTVAGSSQPGGFVDDPDAEIGAGTTYGHDLVPGANTVGAADWSNSPAFGTPDFAEGFSSGGPGDLLFDGRGRRLPAPVADGKVDVLAPDGTDVSTPGYQPFLGTSAAAPAAAAVAALMLQADPALTPRQVTASLEASATSFGLPSAEQGSGLIQAPQAVEEALDLADPAPTRRSGRNGAAFVFTRSAAQGEDAAGVQGHGSRPDRLAFPSDLGSLSEAIGHATQGDAGVTTTDPPLGPAYQAASVGGARLFTHHDTASSTPRDAA